MKKKPTKSLMVAACGISMCSFEVFAQEIRQPAGVLEEVIVTSQRREESLQDVPISVARIGTEQLEEIAADGLLDLADVVPNLSYRTNGVPTTRIALRGVGNNDFNQNVDAPVGVILDELAIVNAVAQNVAIFDLESVQVSRGPQGTLFGRNTTGGAILYTSRRPSQETEGNVSLTLGRFDEMRVDGGVSFSVSDTLSTRIAFQSVNRDGTASNLFDGIRLNDQKSTAARTSLLWEPSDNAEFLFKIDYRKADQDSFGGKARQLVDPEVLEAQLASGVDFLTARATAQAAGEAAFEAAGGPRFIAGFVDYAGYSETNFDPYTLNWNLRPTQIWEDIIGTAIGTFHIGDVTLTTVTGVVDHELFNLYEIDQTPLDTTHLLRSQSDFQVSQEFRLASDTDQQLSWIAGLYLMRDELEVRNRFGFDGSILGVDGFTTQDYNQETTSYAAFGTVFYEMSPAITLTAGGRYTYEEKTFDQENFLVPSDDITDFRSFDVAMAMPLIPFLESSQDFNEWSGRLALDYKFAEEMMVYGSVSRGFRSGGFSGGILFPNSFVNSEGLDPFDPEILVSYEAGFKGDLLGKRLRLNVAAFFYDYDDLQVFLFRDDPTTPESDFAQLTENAAAAEIIGAEIELQALLTGSITLDLSVGLLDSEYTDFVDPLLGDFSGNELVAAPNYEIRAQLTHVWEGLGGEVSSRVDVYTRGSRFYDPSNLARLSEPDDFTTVGFSVGWRNESGLSLRAYGRNIFDEDSLQDVIVIPGTGYDMLHFTDPATYGLTFGYEF